MLDKNIRPSTIGGIKRYAKQLKKANHLSHHDALDIAARLASFENFAHARNQLQYSDTIKSFYNLFLTTYWYDNKSRKAGREVLEVKLSMPLLKIATKSELRKANTLGWFRVVSPDLLVDDHICHSQEAAITKICKAARTLSFMETTGLKPTRDSKLAYPNKDYKNKLPDSDHVTFWSTSDSGKIVIIDEPYLEPVVDGERAAWAKKHNWYLQASKWAGMYAPGFTNMFVSTDASTGYDFEGLMARIDNIPDPITIKNWCGISSSGHDTFLSPLCITAQDKKRAVSKGTIYRASSSKTLPMRSWNAPYNQRRPNGVMPIESHLLAARLIKAIQQSAEKPMAVNKRLSSIKSMLEDWFFSEYDRNVTDNYDLFYYGSIDRNDPFVLRADSSKGITSLLHDLKEILLNAYVECEPLRKIIGKINTSIKLTSSL